MKILILCTGNSCRSQMAHGFLQAFDDRLTVRSAGTDPAGQVNPDAIRFMKETGIDISNHKPLSVDQYLDEPWDFVITVCDHARETCPAFSGDVKRRLHIGFEDPSLVVGSEYEIRLAFTRVRDGIRNAFHRLYINKIQPLL
ncbi:MAG: arsenate reductase ArsC [Bacteroidales bacterium]|nr:arsenate reductase ArsC [Bacteroidales bacterium]MBN2697657.1 arsenate reductase ArsC [Bacteroidales bacterium]